MQGSLSGPLLAVETSTRTAYVALTSAAGATLASAYHTADRHSGNLLALCDRLFQETDTTPAQLGAIACSAGPGSFTGLRVGMSVAKGLALPFATPLILVSSLHTLAIDLSLIEEARGTASIVACLDAGKGELHVQEFIRKETAVQASSEPLRLLPTDLVERLRGRQSELLVGGPQLTKFQAMAEIEELKGVHLFAAMPGPSAQSLAALALAALARGETTDLATAAPTYGRGPDITTPKRKIVGVGPVS